MPGKRSRQGCEECRKRRRKCDEKTPACGQCTSFSRTCQYTLKLVWGGRPFKKSRFGTCLGSQGGIAEVIPADNGGAIYGTRPRSSTIALVHEPPALIPQSLPHGVPIPQRYRRLLSYFTQDVLPSLSCHPSINEDLCRGLLPAMLQSPHLLSASLALSAAGFASRGLTEVDGVEISRVTEHLQTSGLGLLRAAVARGQMDETLLATCLIWCLADVFAGRQGMASWRVHLQGMNAILRDEQAHKRFGTDPGPAQIAMRHLYLLYLSLQTLPQLPSFYVSEQSELVDSLAMRSSGLLRPLDPKIDGFLGYSQEVLEILQRINSMPINEQGNTEEVQVEADFLLGKIKGMIIRDAMAPPEVSISSALSPESGRDFALCHQAFQHATLIHLYRRLYNEASGSELIQGAVQTINEIVSNMTQGQPCHTWVAMSMPLFTIGCEAFSDFQKEFVLDKINKLEICLGSLHVQIIRQALQDIWTLRTGWGDFNGALCASQLLKEVPYNIILF